MTRTIISSHSHAPSEDMNIENQMTADNSDHPDRHSDIELNFWDLNPKEHLWSRLKALQLYENANVFIMLYNADDRESF